MRLQLKANLFDRLVATVAPLRAMTQVVHRAQFAALTGGQWRGGSKSRRPTDGWAPKPGSANADNLADLPTLRARSRDLMRNAPIAAGALETVVTNVIGAGLRVTPKIDATALGLSQDAARAWEKKAETIWCEWAENADECDIRRTLTFADMQAVAFRSDHESGDVFVLRRYRERAGSTFGTRLQLIEGDRVCNPNYAGDTATLAGGVEVDADGAPRAYHVTRTHPGDTVLRPKLEWEVLPAFDEFGDRQVLHIFRSLRPEQTRGMPFLATALEKFKQLADYGDAELSAALVAALPTLFVKTDSGAGLAPAEPVAESGGSVTDKDAKLIPGMLMQLAKGEDVTAPVPGRPNSEFANFVTAVLREIGVSLGLPYEVLIKHFSSSYSASRAALIEAWRFYRNRRAWFARNACQPVYAWVIGEAIARGRLAAPAFFSSPAVRRAYLGARWIGPGMTQIDPLKEVEAYAQAEDRGYITAQQATAELNGGNWEDNIEQRGDEEQQRIDAGVPVPRGNAGAAPRQFPSDEPEQAPKQSEERRAA